MQSLCTIELYAAIFCAMVCAEVVILLWVAVVFLQISELNLPLLFTIRKPKNGRDPFASISMMN